MSEPTIRRKLKSAIERTREAAAKFYSENEPPEHYIDHLAGVEVGPEPMDVGELVLSTYRS